MTGLPFAFAGAHLVADPSGALFWPAERALMVADLHFEKGSSFAARGAALLPPYDIRHPRDIAGSGAGDSLLPAAPGHLPRRQFS